MDWPTFWVFLFLGNMDLNIFLKILFLSYTIAIHIKFKAIAFKYTNNLKPFIQEGTVTHDLLFKSLTQ
jgi:hypothetical protein